MSYFKLPKFMPPSEIMKMKSGQRCYVVAVIDGQIHFEGLSSPLGKRMRSPHKATRFSGPGMPKYLSWIMREGVRKNGKFRNSYPNWRNQNINWSLKQDTTPYLETLADRRYRFCFRKETDAHLFIKLHNEGHYPHEHKVSFS